MRFLGLNITRAKYAPDVDLTNEIDEIQAAIDAEIVTELAGRGGSLTGKQWRIPFNQLIKDSTGARVHVIAIIDQLCRHPKYGARFRAAIPTGAEIPEKFAAAQPIQMREYIFRKTIGDTYRYDVATG